MTRYQRDGFWDDLMNETLSEIKDAIQREEYESAILRLDSPTEANKTWKPGDIVKVK